MVLLWTELCPSNSYVEALPLMHVFGDGACEDVIRAKRGHMDEALIQ